jgi:hypothetical protein
MRVCKTKTWRLAAVGVMLFVGAVVVSADEAPRMSWLDNGQIRLGVDLSIGGAVTHLSEGKDGVNMIYSFDWGRQIQMSFYSGLVPFVPEGGARKMSGVRSKGELKPR